MASVPSQLIEEVTTHAQSDSPEDAREICADGTYFPNNLRIYARSSLELNRNILGCTTVFATCLSLNPCRRVVLEKLMGSQVARVFSALYRTRRFITAFTRACHLFPPWDKGFQSLQRIFFIITLTDGLRWWRPSPWSGTRVRATSWWQAFD